MSRKTEIIEVAQKLFETQGYEATSMRTLAEHLGIEASSLYSHYKSKEDILWEVASNCADDFFKNIEPIYTSSLNTKSKLKQMIIAHVEVLLKNQSAAQVFLTEWRSLSTERRSEYACRIAAYEEYFMNVLAQGVRDNLFSLPDEKFGTLSLLASLNWTAKWYKPTGDMNPTQIGERMADLLLNGYLKHY